MEKCPVVLESTQSTPVIYIYIPSPFHFNGDSPLPNHPERLIGRTKFILDVFWAADSISDLYLNHRGCLRGVMVFSWSLAEHESRTRYRASKSLRERPKHHKDDLFGSNRGQKWILRPHISLEKVGEYSLSRISNVWEYIRPNMANLWVKIEIGASTRYMKKWATKWSKIRIELIPRDKVV